MTKQLLLTLSVLHAEREMKQLVPAFQQRNWTVNVVIGFAGDSAERLAQSMQALGAAVHRVPAQWMYGAVSSSGTARPGSSKARKSKPPRIPTSLRPLVNTMLYARRGFLQRRHARRLLKEIAPTAVVANNFHSCCEFDNALNVEATRSGIARACVLTSPLVAGIIAKRARLANFRSGMLDGSYRAAAHWFARSLARVKPNWTVGEGNERILCWPAEKLVGAQLSGLVRRDIWENPSGDFDRIYAPSEKSRQLMLQSNTPDALIRVFGPPRLDDVVVSAGTGELAKTLSADLGIRAGEPFILYNVEPSWEHHYCDRETHFARIGKIAAYLATLPIRTIVSLHPLCSIADYEGVLECYPNITISRSLGIEYLYPTCRLALSFGCSTNAYAIMWGKPVVMYDWFGIKADAWRWSLYDQPCLTAVNSQEALQLAVASELAAERQQSSSAHTVAQPAEAAPRIVADIEALIASRKAAPV